MSKFRCDPCILTDTYISEITYLKSKYCRNCNNLICFKVNTAFEPNRSYARVRFKWMFDWLVTLQPQVNATSASLTRTTHSANYQAVS